MLGRQKGLLEASAETGLQQEEPSCVPPPQLCKGEETRGGGAGFELVVSCKAQGKELIRTML